VLHILDRMQKLGERRAQRSPTSVGKITDLKELLTLARPVIKRRSVLFVVSDFISAPGWSRGMADLARRHDVVAVRLTDPMETELPDLGLVVMQDAETGEQLLVDTHDSAFRKRFARPPSSVNTRCAPRSARRRSTASNSPPTSRSTRRCCGSRSCASVAASSHPAPCRATCDDRLEHRQPHVPVADHAVAAAGAPARHGRLLPAC
jgi:hypothetical protein